MPFWSIWPFQRALDHPLGSGQLIRTQKYFAACCLVTRLWIAQFVRNVVRSLHSFARQREVSSFQNEHSQISLIAGNSPQVTDRFADLNRLGYVPDGTQRVSILVKACREGR